MKGGQPVAVSSFAAALLLRGRVPGLAQGFAGQLAHLVPLLSGRAADELSHLAQRNGLRWGREVRLDCLYARHGSVLSTVRGFSFAVRYYFVFEAESGPLFLRSIEPLTVEIGNGRDERLGDTPTSIAALRFVSWADFGEAPKGTSLAFGFEVDFVENGFRHFLFLFA